MGWETYEHPPYSPVTIFVEMSAGKNQTDENYSKEIEEVRQLALKLLKF